MAVNSIYGTDGRDVLAGTTGDDEIYGLAGNDKLTGGTGNDLLDGGTGDDVMIGNAGDDTYVVNSIADHVVEKKNEGLDTVMTALRAYSLRANVENLTFTTTDDSPHVGYGNELANVIRGGAGTDALRGQAGADTIYGNAGNDRIYGGAGNDTLYGGTGIDRLYGGTGNDTLDGGGGADSMIGGKGNDTYFADATGDRVIEGKDAGTDQVMAVISYRLPKYVENLTLVGNKAANATGNDLDNVLLGNEIKNVLKGLDGNDTLDGGLAADTLTGGAGADSFRFSTKLDGDNNIDVITDFSHGDGDKIVLDHAIFAALDRGPLPAGDFVVGPKATDPDHHIIYNQATGALLYDADGQGGDPAVQFATIGATNHPGLVAGDFLII